MPTTLVEPTSIPSTSSMLQPCVLSVAVHDRASAVLTCTLASSNGPVGLHAASELSAALCSRAWQCASSCSPIELDRCSIVHAWIMHRKLLSWSPGISCSRTMQPSSSTMQKLPQPSGTNAAGLEDNDSSVRHMKATSASSEGIRAASKRETIQRPVRSLVSSDVVSECGTGVACVQWRVQSGPVCGIKRVRKCYLHTIDIEDPCEQFKNN
jgi:hypothetical protein